VQVTESTKTRANGFINSLKESRDNETAATSAYVLAQAKCKCFCAILLTLMPKVMLLLFCFFLAHSPVCRADSDDPVEKILAIRPTGNPETIEYVKELIKNNKDHPKILELRFYRTGQLTGNATQAGFHSIISDLNQLADDAGSATELNFRCRSRIGEIYFHCLRDKPAAYAEYKGLESHPSLAGHALATDYRRTELCLRIAESALATHKWDELEAYTRLVMAYPYLGMEDRVLYQKFYDLYDQAGRLFVAGFAGDPDKLRSIEIYPSHPELNQERHELLVRSLGLDDPTPQLLSPEEMDKSLKPTKDEVAGSSASAAGGQAAQSPTAQQSTGTALPAKKQNGQTPWSAIICVVVAAAAVSAVVYAVKRRRVK
jgi:hypothetical protein